MPRLTSRRIRSGPRPHDTVEGCERLLDDVGSPALKLNLQFDGLGEEIGLDKAATYRRLAPHIVHMHVPVEPAVDDQAGLRALFAAMRMNGFEGFVSVEVHLGFSARVSRSQTK